MFSDLSSQAKPSSPAASFDCFLAFHQEIAQAVIDMEKIQAATTTSAEQPLVKEDSSSSSSILQEILHNTPDQAKKPSNGRQLRSHGSKKASSNASDDDKAVLGNSSSSSSPPSSSSLGSSIKLAKEVQTEAASWFMEFLELALEVGLKKVNAKGGGRDVDKSPATCPQSLILKVINWVEVEQSDSSKRPVHPRAAQIARKLRIKAKNP